MAPSDDDATWWHGLPPPWREACASAPDLAARLAEATALGRRAHAGVEVPTEVFAAYLFERGLADATGGVAFAADLYLCCACLRGDPRAVAAFDAALVGTIEPALARMGLAREERAEIAQALRVRLVVGDEGVGKLADYAGRSSLASWLHAAAVRTALSSARQRARLAALDDDWLEWPSPADDPEMAALKRTCGAAFRAAFAEAFGSLEPRARLLLRQSLLDGLGIEQLGALYGVHPSTAFRWLRDARSSLVTATRAAFAPGRRLPANEFDSLIRLLESQLDASVRRMLAHD
jgi:RNA polymerase sigma-70 factor, ECF subfamily